MTPVSAASAARLVVVDSMSGAATGAASAHMLVRHEQRGGTRAETLLSEAYAREEIAID